MKCCALLHVREWEGGRRRPRTSSALHFIKNNIYICSSAPVHRLSAHTTQSTTRRPKNLGASEDRSPTASARQASSHGHSALAKQLAHASRHAGRIALDMCSSNASRLRDSAAAAIGSTACQNCCFSTKRRHQRSLPERRLCWWRSTVSVHALGRAPVACSSHPAWGRYQYVPVCVTVSPAEGQACMGCMQQPATATCSHTHLDLE